MSFQFEAETYENAYAHLLERIQLAVQTTFAEERVARGLSVTEIGRKLGISPSVVTLRISGVGQVTLRSICDLYIAMGREPFANFQPFTPSREYIETCQDPKCT